MLRFLRSLLLPDKRPEPETVTALRALAEELLELATHLGRVSAEVRMLDNEIEVLRPEMQRWCERRDRAAKHENEELFASASALADQMRDMLEQLTDALIDRNNARLLLRRSLEENLEKWVKFLRDDESNGHDVSDLISLEALALRLADDSPTDLEIETLKDDPERQFVAQVIDGLH